MYINMQSSLFTNNLKKSQNNIQKAIEKLGIGKRICSASDDAAGLAISEKMRALARGERQAIRNVQDANSMIGTAEGAMNEIAEIVQRMRELEVKAANGTYTEEGEASVADTYIIQKEIDSLKKELHNIIENTHFNTHKMLTNKEVGEYIYENRSISKNFSSIETSKTTYISPQYNYQYENRLSALEYDREYNYTSTPSITTIEKEPYSYVSTTVYDHIPRWTNDGNSVVFSSTRDNNYYVVPKDASVASVLKNSESIASQKTSTNNSLYRLRVDSSTEDLYLDKRSSIHSSWYSLRRYTDYSYNEGGSGYSFSPIETGGNTSFVYTDSIGNIKRVDLDINTGSTSASNQLILTTDTLNIPPTNNTISLGATPNLYRMNDASGKDSLVMYKNNDNGSRKLVYWDGTGSAPADGNYYTISGSLATFHGNTIIGNEAGDDAQDYYSFSYVSDGTGNNFFTRSIFSSYEIYNMHGEVGPRSLNILVGSKKVERSDLLSARPADVEGTNGVYVDDANNKIEFYGDFRPAYGETVYVKYLGDSDGRNEVYTTSVSKYIDTYNLEDLDLSKNRSMRVYLDGTELKYSNTNGYTYDKNTGKISFYGDARPDLPSNPSVQIKYAVDNTTSNTTRDVYGISLSYTPEIYNFDTGTSPESLSVYRNTNEKIPYSNVNGFQYNQSKNMIELYGTSRPDVNDIYTIKMVREVGIASSNIQNGIVELTLSKNPETYGISDPNIPETFSVLVDGTKVNYDSTKTNGFFYNSTSNTIELYGNARPKAGDTHNYDVKVNYVYENPYVNTGNESYDFKLNSSLNYGIETGSSPKAIRVYKGNSEIPYDSNNGFTFDSVTQILSIHGSYKPDGDDLSNTYKVSYIKDSDLKMNIPSNSFVYDVKLNGKKLYKVDDSTGNGYTYSGNTIQVVGDERIDVNKNTSSIKFDVIYSESLEFNLDDTISEEFSEAYCKHELDTKLSDAEVNKESLKVTLDGNVLSGDTYSLSGMSVILDKDKLNINMGSHNISVDYNIRYPSKYKANSYVFQVGANQNQSMQVDFESFDNLLRKTDIICVRTHECAEKGIEVLDEALDFVINQRSKLGGVENALEHINSNLSCMEENTTKSLSVIEDADMAKEVMNNIKYQMLNEVQQSLLLNVVKEKERVLNLLE